MTSPAALPSVVPGPRSLRFRSVDAARVETTWQEFVPSATLHRVDPNRFRFDWHSESLAHATLIRYDLAAQVRSTAAPEDQLLVCRVDSPDARIWGADDLDPRRPWISDGRPVHARWEAEATVRALVFDRDAAERLARRVSGDDRLRLRVLEAAPVTAAASADWEAAFSYLEKTLPSLAPEDAVLRAALERHALTRTLSAFSTTFADSVRRTGQTRPAPAAVRRALRFIEENAHRPITVDDVASAVHMSIRGLQYAFRRSLDETPASCLRRARLEGARRELREGGPERIAVIARRWGFSHPSRFAAAYREEYGRPPAADRPGR